MTIPRGAQRVTEMVLDMIPHLRNRLTPGEQALVAHLRGNALLYEALTGLIKSRIGGRSAVAEPSDPLVCKSMLARDRELQWLLGRLDLVYRAPVQPPQDDSEQPG